MLAQAALSTHDRAFARAAERCPPRTARIRLGGIGIKIAVCGPMLAERLLAPFAHLSEPTDAAPDIVLRAWSEAETGVPSPEMAGDNCYVTQGHHAWVDEDPDRAILWFSSADDLTRGDTARPFQRVLIPMLGRRNLTSVHAALVSAPDVSPEIGLMLVGPSRTGKSTTTLAALDAGFGVVGDDCFALERRADNSLVGHSMFGTACLTEDAETRFAALPGTIFRPANASPKVKSVLVFDEGPRNPMRDALPVHAIVYPVLRSDLADSRMVPVDTAEAMRRFMPGLRFLVRFEELGRMPVFSWLTDIAEELPAYRLELSPQISQTPALLRQLAAELAESHV